MTARIHYGLQKQRGSGASSGARGAQIFDNQCALAGLHLCRFNPALLLWVQELSILQIRMARG